MCSAEANREGMNGFQSSVIYADPQGLLMIGLVLLIVEVLIHDYLEIVKTQAMSDGSAVVSVLCQFGCFVQ